MRDTIEIIERINGHQLCLPISWALQVLWKQPRDLEFDILQEVSGISYKALPIKENLRNSTSPHALYLARLVGLWVWPYFLKSSRCGRSHRSNYKKRLGEGEGSQRFLFREVVYDSKGFLESINTVWKGLQTNSSRFYHSVSDTTARAAHPRKRTAWRVKHFI